MAHKRTKQAAREMINEVGIRVAAEEALRIAGAEKSKNEFVQYVFAFLKRKNARTAAKRAGAAAEAAAATPPVADSGEVAVPVA